jgi:hypothetical protein
MNEIPEIEPEELEEEKHRRRLFWPLILLGLILCLGGAAALHAERYSAGSQPASRRMRRKRLRRRKNWSMCSPRRISSRRR